MSLLRTPAALALPLLAGLLLTGCVGMGPTPCAVGVVQQTPAFRVEPHVFAPGEQVALQFRPAAMTAQQCHGVPQLRPDTVRVTVVDGQNRPVQVSSRLERDGSAPVEFVPETPGAYHVTVLFEPVGGLLQREVLVAIDRTQAPMLSLPAPCAQLQRTMAGAWVCDQRVFRDGQELAPIPPGRILVAGNSVWVASGAVVQLLEDTGSGPLVERTTLSREVGPTDTLVADAQRLVHVAGLRLEAFYLSGDGTLQSPGSTTLPDTRFRSLVLAEGAVLVLTAGIDVMPSPGSADGGTRPGSGDTQACAWTLSPTAPPTPPTTCQTLPRGLVGAMGVDEDGVWTWESSPTISRYRLQGDSLAKEGSLTLPPEALVILPGAGPAPNSAAGQTWVVPRPEGLDLVLERYVTPERGTLGAHAGHVWLSTGSTTTVWLR